MVGHDTHLSHYHLLRMGEMGKVFWAHSLGTVGSSLVTVFIPIFLYKLGFSIQQILIYLALQNFAAFLVQYPATRVIDKIGANRSMALAEVFHTLFFIGLLLLPGFERSLAVLVPVGIAWSITRALYWPAFHANFSKARAHKKAGNQVGAINAVVTFAHGATPAIGGLIATGYGISWAYGLAILLYVIAVTPLLFGDEVTKRRPLNFRNVDYRKTVPDLFSNAMFGAVNLAELVIWPLLVSFIVTSYAGVGLLSSVVTVASIAVTLYVGRREGSKGERHYVKEGTWVTGATNVLRLGAASGGHVAGINLLSGVGHALTVTPFMSRYYERADEEPRLEYITLMEMAHELSWVAYFLLLLTLTAFFPPTTALAVGLAAAVPLSFGARRMVRS